MLHSMFFLFSSIFPVLLIFLQICIYTTLSLFTCASGIFVLGGVQILQIGGNFWMAWASPSTEGDTPKFSNTKLIWVYAGLSLGSSLFIAIRSTLICLSGIFIAQKYFLDMIRCIFRAPMSFFDSTPTGRILNRVCMPIPLVSFVPIFFKTCSIVKCYKFFQIVMASSFSYTHLHLEQSAGKKDFYLKTNYIMNSLSF